MLSEQEILYNLVLYTFTFLNGLFSSTSRNLEDSMTDKYQHWKCIAINLGILGKQHDLNAKSES